MTELMTMSFSKGKKSETSISHNNRSIEPDFDFTKAGHRHIEQQYTPLNQVWIHDDIKTVYDQEFGPAVEAYNQKQKRKDRRIKDYYRKVKNTKTMRTQYEFIVQIGNKDDWDRYSDRNSGRWQDAARMLHEYYKSFQKRNPQLRAYNCALHMDEQGAPHIHLNVVPVANGYKRGVNVRPSLDKALKQEGIEFDPRDSRSLWRNFQQREQGALEQIAKPYDIERISGVTNKLRNVHEYKAAKQAVENEQKRVKQAREQAIKSERNLADKHSELRQTSAEIDAKKRQSKRLDTEIKEKQDKSTQLDKEITQKRRKLANMEPDKALKEENSKLRQRLEIYHKVLSVAIHTGIKIAKRFKAKFLLGFGYELERTGIFKDFTDLTYNISADGNKDLHAGAETYRNRTSTAKLEQPLQLQVIRHTIVDRKSEWEQEQEIYYYEPKQNRRPKLVAKSLADFERELSDKEPKQRNIKQQILAGRRDDAKEEIYQLFLSRNGYFLNPTKNDFEKANEGAGLDPAANLNQIQFKEIKPANNQQENKQEQQMLQKEMQRRFNELER